MGQVGKCISCNITFDLEDLPNGSCLFCKCEVVAEPGEGHKIDWPADEAKRCRDCRKIKPLSEFSVAYKKTGRLRPECRECAAKNCRERYYYNSARAKGRNTRARKNVGSAIETLKIVQNQILDLEKRLGGDDER